MESGLNSLLSAKEDLGLWAQDEDSEDKLFASKHRCMSP